MSALGADDRNFVDVDRIEAIAARLDLRQPNREALESIVCEAGQHYEVDREPPPFEAVVALATGVGKTYILASAIEYFAGDRVRNFAVITPGRTILTKTVGNFTPGHPKSLLGGMEVRPVVITSENFATPSMRAAMDDPEQVKLFIFTVQALLRPESAVGRKTHKFQEGLGQAFYAHLQTLDDLVVFADEHHCYYGPAFSSAVRNLQPRELIGLTATPDRKTPADQIVFRYPLAAAIADRLVKTPVLVGRKDDRVDMLTKLLDGVKLLELKEAAITRWCSESGADPVAPMMLVIAPDIAEAEEIRQVIVDASFAGGQYTDRVLTVHSKAPDEALAQLEKLEDPDSPFRIVISVGMLKEGWDVKNVYVIASMRASVSDLLTEQTLGRGLRLPFGRYTDVEMLDTLEVLGHERYEELLKKAGVLNEQFIDRRTRAMLRRNAQGQLVSVPQSEVVQTSVIPADRADLARDQSTAAMPIKSIEDHMTQVETQLANLNVQLAPREVEPPLHIPVLRMTQMKSEFSLADITNLEPFRRLGESIAVDPAGSLRRVALRAEIVAGADGLRRTELVTARALDRVESPALLSGLDDLRQQLLDRLLCASVVPARANQRYPAAQIVDALLRGLGPAAEKILSGYLDRAAAGLIQLVTDEQRQLAPKPSYGEVVEIADFSKIRVGRAQTTGDRFGTFKKGLGYEGLKKSLYAQDWFDSSTERDVANLLEDEDSIGLWVRLQIGDLPILWSTAREYNPDFIAIDQDQQHWVIEVKMDKEMQSADVQEKRDAARRWANYVSADDKVATIWGYVLVSETDVRIAKGSWPALRALAGE